jgi:LuxR family transcriptional regulator, maltose regulon positive regulatory protein
MAQLLSTKLLIPFIRQKLVSRPHLVERLNQGLQRTRSLTLISAPAGFGKTTLISQWVISCDRPAVWLSLDEGDNDPNCFLTYLVAALQTVVPNLEEKLAAVFQAPQLQTELILTALLNEITAHAENFILILNEYHVINSKLVEHALTFLLDHLPPQMHLVISTRQDPDLPLARFRLRGQLTELRAADLRFSVAEATKFLNQVMQLHLSEEDITALETRTEGWIAGLQLAALSIQGQKDVPGFVRAFAGDNRYIMEYLVEEVLKRQPESVRRFLLKTSILGDLNGSLCDAVTGQPGGKARLENLQRGNFFLSPVDDRRYWYRYHPLFAQVLYVYLTSEEPDQVPILHRRASEWYEHNGLPADAIRHALAGEAFERESALLEPLSQRELEILRLYKTELSGPAIARELVIALSTVRTHAKNIYSKLGVNNRQAAVRRAEELGLV